MKIDRSTWGRLRVTGSDRVRFLQGLTTVNVEQLADAQHAWGAILSPKGRVLSVIDIARTGDAMIITCEPSIAEKTKGILEKYAVMDDVVFEPMEGAVHQVWNTVDDVWTAPFVEGAGEVEAAELLRIRAGFLRYGADVDEDHFPFETPLAKMLDYGKGCYVGQEPVFRVYSQGNAARMLRGITVEGTAPIAQGAQVKHPAQSGRPAKDNAGVVTSSVVDGDTTRVLAYLHRTCWEPGGTVEMDGRKGTVFELPW